MSLPLHVLTMLLSLTEGYEMVQDWNGLQC